MHAMLLAILPALTGRLLSVQSARLPGRSALLRLRGGGGAETPQEEWDYIILGGGAAGCVLANRLSADPSNRVLVLEAGGDASRDLKVRIPAMLIKVLRSDIDWNFETVPDGPCDHSVYLCRGKTLGGSSCTNVQLYHRGTEADYKAWEQAGATGWGPKDVLPYFRKSERHLGGVSKYHSTDGEMAVGHAPYFNPLSAVFMEAVGELGFRHNHDFSDWSAPQEGFGRFKLTQENGERVSTATTFLKEARHRPNLCVRTGAHATKLVLEGTNDVAATGIEYQSGGEAKTARLASRGEVLMAAGAVQSPQLLMLSGIGPRSHLEEMGIKVRKELNGVGQGLQDHPAVLVSYESKKKCSLTDHIRLWGTPLPNPVTLLDWFVRGKGALTTVACEQGGFFRTRPDKAEADLQMRFVPERSMSPDGMNSLVKMGSGNVAKAGFTFQLLACRPQARGRVRLRDADPFSKPLVENLYLSHGTSDLATLREGIKFGRSVCQAGAFDGVRGKEIFPGEAVQSDADIERYVRDTLHSANALTGSCRMGAANDPLAVLDPQLRVRGVRGLRVVDASAIPKITGGQTVAPTIMIAEKAADHILQARQHATRQPQVPQPAAAYHAAYPAPAAAAAA